MDSIISHQPPNELKCRIINSSNLLGGFLFATLVFRFGQNVLLQSRLDSITIVGLRLCPGSTS